MPLWKSREQREAERADLERQDREYSARLADLSANVPRVTLYCQDCEGKLRPTATACHYCGSHNLGPDQPSCPRFSVATIDGACPRCHGTSFRAPGMVGTMTAAGFLAGGAVGAAIGAAAGAASPNDVILCVTCGARFRRG